MARKKRKKQNKHAHERIRNPFIPALIKRRPSTQHEDKKRKHIRKLRKEISDEDCE